jgi:hypothetical protein
MRFIDRSSGAPARHWARARPRIAAGAKLRLINGVSVIAKFDGEHNAMPTPEVAQVDRGSCGMSALLPLILQERRYSRHPVTHSFCQNRDIPPRGNTSAAFFISARAFTPNNQSRRTASDTLH